MFDLVDYFQACSKVVKFISSIALTIHGSLDGKNVEVVLTELGNRLHRVIFEHLQQFQYNSLGRFMNIAYQNKNHTFNWLNTLHVTFTIPRYRLEC
jgi:recyclin-1